MYGQDITVKAETLAPLLNDRPLWGLAWIAFCCAREQVLGAVLMKQAINKYGEPALRQLVARAQAQPEATRVVVLREVATLRRLGVTPWASKVDSHLQFHILQEKRLCIEEVQNVSFRDSLRIQQLQDRIESDRDWSERIEAYT